MTLHLTTNGLKSTSKRNNDNRLVQIMRTTGKYDYVHASQLKELQKSKQISYIV